MAHLDDMHRFIRLTEANELPEVDDLIIEDISELEDSSDRLIESISDVVFKLQSYRELSGSSDYQLGVEEGLALAAEMLTRLVESVSGKA